MVSKVQPSLVPPPPAQPVGPPLQGQPVERRVPGRWRPAAKEAGSAFVGGVAVVGTGIAGGVSAGVLTVTAPVGLAIAGVVSLSVSIVVGLKRYLKSGLDADILQAENDAASLERNILQADSEDRIGRVIRHLSGNEDVFRKANMMRRQKNLLIMAYERHRDLRMQRGTLENYTSFGTNMPNMLTRLQNARNDVKTCWFFNTTHYRDVFQQVTYDLRSALGGRAVTVPELADTIAFLKLWRSEDSSDAFLSEALTELVLLSFIAMLQPRLARTVGGRRAVPAAFDGDSDEEGDIHFT